MAQKRSVQSHTDNRLTIFCLLVALIFMFVLGMSMCSAVQTCMTHAKIQRQLSRADFHSQVEWHSPLIPALWRLRQVYLCEFEASLVYTVSSRTA